MGSRKTKERVVNADLHSSLAVVHSIPITSTTDTASASFAFHGRTRLFCAPLDLLASTDATRSGLRTTEILVDGQIRFRVIYNINSGKVDLRDVQSVGSDHYLARRPFKQLDRKTRLSKRPTQVFTALKPNQQPLASSMSGRNAIWKAARCCITTASRSTVTRWPTIWLSNQGFRQ